MILKSVRCDGRYSLRNHKVCGIPLVRKQRATAAYFERAALVGENDVAFRDFGRKRDPVFSQFVLPLERTVRPVFGQFRRSVAHRPAIKALVRVFHRIDHIADLRRDFILRFAVERGLTDIDFFRIGRDCLGVLFLARVVVVLVKMMLPVKEDLGHLPFAVERDLDIGIGHLFEFGIQFIILFEIRNKVAKILFVFADPVHFLIDFCRFSLKIIPRTVGIFGGFSEDLFNRRLIVPDIDFRDFADPEDVEFQSERNRNNQSERDQHRRRDCNLFPIGFAKRDRFHQPFLLGLLFERTTAVGAELRAFGKRGFAFRADVLCESCSAIRAEVPLKLGSAVRAFVHLFFSNLIK